MKKISCTKLGQVSGGLRIKIGGGSGKFTFVPKTKKPDRKQNQGGIKEKDFSRGGRKHRKNGVSGYSSED